MKKMISLVICLLMLCTLCTPIFAYTPSELMNMAKNEIKTAKSYKDSGDLLLAGLYYNCAAIHFASNADYYELAAYAYGLAADAYEKDGADNDANVMRDNQEYYTGLAKARGGCVKPEEVFNGDDIIKPSGFVLSEGNLTILVGIAAAAVFGLGGFFLGKTIEKKKTVLAAEGTEKKAA